jgi:predicted SprT family Zn-dependent metalloprotease
MNFAEKAFTELFPDRQIPAITYKYSGKFGLYNANVRKTFGSIEFGLSGAWKSISDEIKIGLVQHLLLKLYKTKKSTLNIELYDNFIKHAHLSIQKNKSEPFLELSFNKINEKYFSGLVEKPNLAWGSESRSTLGAYNYNSDTITISSIFKNAPEIFVDFVMYHEMLHKKIKFSKSGGRNYHHTNEFRKSERDFENHKIVEKELQSFLRKKRRRIRKSSWWFI